jgi:hypothetical protein
VDRDAAVQQLPAMHAVAVRLCDAGLRDDVIATALGIDDDQVPNVLGLANAKLTNLMALDHV